MKSEDHLGAINPDNWRNIPKCLIKAIKVLIGEHNDLNSRVAKIKVGLEVVDQKVVTRERRNTIKDTDQKVYIVKAMEQQQK